MHWLLVMLVIGWLKFVGIGINEKAKDCRGFLGESAIPLSIWLLERIHCQEDQP